MQVRLANPISRPVGRAAEAAVCRTAEAGATPARDSISFHAAVMFNSQHVCLPSRSSRCTAVREANKSYRKLIGRAWEAHSGLPHQISTPRRRSAGLDGSKPGLINPVPVVRFHLPLPFHASRAREEERRPFKPRGQGATPWRCTTFRNDEARRPKAEERPNRSSPVAHCFSDFVIRLAFGDSVFGFPTDLLPQWPNW